MAESEFTFTLTSPLQYHDSGKLEDGYELILKAPSNKNRIESAKLKQGFFRAMKGLSDTRGNVQSESESASDSVISGSEVMSVIMMSSVDLAEYQENFRVLLISGVCSVKGIKLTSPMFDSLSDSDTERLMGEYIANFLLASHLSKMATK